MEKSKLVEVDPVESTKASKSKKKSSGIRGDREYRVMKITNDFMFNKVMSDESICKEVVELIIGKKI